MVLFRKRHPPRSSRLYRKVYVPENPKLIYLLKLPGGTKDVLVSEILVCRTQV